MHESPVDPSTVQHLLGYALAQARVAANRAFFQAIGEPMQLRTVEFSLLMLLLPGEGLSQRQLAQALNLSAPNLTLVVSRLQSRGLLVRERNPTDRRAQAIRLTAEGLSIARQAHATSLEMEAGLRQLYSPAEWALLLELLQRVSPGALSANEEQARTVQRQAPRAPIGHQRNNIKGM
ncbi:MarR family transcriptional regulator [Acidovorax sp. SUPP950]|uniref:MarR family winged helix-turn-helix transcriptional regulator n=1 Tax=Acidovorax sp. SUPP950 TaxID=511901 RepID=UPI0023D7A007|nr:MarR family transcriptional regulator [Acidovorax sp. SUPP950]GKS73833.1 MarR family transcriptional regulator [Acidovorax sp. SUPP950]